MKIRVKVIPRAKRPGVFENKEGYLVVAVSAPPIKNKANLELVARLADHFGVAKSRVMIIDGFGSRLKTIEVE